MATNIKTLKDSNGDIVAPRTTVSAVFLEDLETTIEDALDQKAITDTFTATIAETSWTGSEAPYSKAVTVTGILSTDTPIIDLVLTGTYATDEAMVADWAKIYRAVTSADTITFYAKEVPTASIDIQLQVIR